MTGIEIWKPIRGYEGLYEVSSFGNIKRNGKNLKQSTIGIGYKRVSLCNNSFKENCSVHRLVACHFIENFEQKPCCNHKDKNPANNNITNLEWVTYSENELHSLANGKTIWNKGKKMSDEFRKKCSIISKNRRQPRSTVLKRIESLKKTLREKKQLARLRQ